MPWVPCFPVLLMTDSAAWKKTPRKIGMKMVRLLKNPVFSQRAWFCCLEMVRGG